VPALPACLMEPLWGECAAQLPARPPDAPTHPLGCHRRRVPERLVCEPVIAALVPGSGYERSASRGCSDGTSRRRLREWAGLGLAEAVHALALRAYDRMIGRELEELAVDACIPKAPGGGEAAGRSPVDRGKQGLTRVVLTESPGLPLHRVRAGAHRHDAPLLGPPAGGAVHLDRADDGGQPRPAGGAGAGGRHRPQGGCRPRCRPARAGRWSARTRG